MSTISSNKNTNNGEKSLSDRLTFITDYMKDELIQFNKEVEGNQQHFMEYMIGIKGIEVSKHSKIYCALLKGERNFAEIFINGKQLEELISKNLFIDTSFWYENNNERLYKLIVEGFEKKKEIEEGEKRIRNLNFYDVIRKINDIDKKLKLNIPIEEKEKQNEILINHRNKSSSNKITSERWSRYSQVLIVKLLKQYYLNGEYNLILDKIIPNLSYTAKSTTLVRKIEAHCLGSNEVEKYYDAAEILFNIYYDSEEKDLDAITSAISNYRRFILLDDNINKSEFKQRLLNIYDLYTKVYKKDLTPNYYPAINVSYIQKILETCYDDINLVPKIKQLRKRVKKSIDLDKENNEISKIYASITDFKLQLLDSDNLFPIIKKLLKYLKNELIHKDYYIKVIRQFEFYTHCLEFNKKIDDNLYKQLKRVIEVFRKNDYNVDNIKNEDLDLDNKKIFLLSTNKLTKEQKKEAEKKYAIKYFITLDCKLLKIWNDIPDDIEDITELITPIKNFLKEKSYKNDIVLISGDINATYKMIEFTKAINLIPIQLTSSKNIIYREF